MKNFLAYIFNYVTKNPKTTIGAMIIIVGLALWAFSKITTSDYVLVLGVAGAWIAITAQDQKS